VARHLVDMFASEADNGIYVHSCRGVIGALKNEIELRVPRLIPEAGQGMGGGLIPPKLRIPDASATAFLFIEMDPVFLLWLLRFGKAGFTCSRYLIGPCSLAL